MLRLNNTVEAVELLYTKCGQIIMWHIVAFGNSKSSLLKCF